MRRGDRRIPNAGPVRSARAFAPAATALAFVVLVILALLPASGSSAQEIEVTLGELPAD